MRRSYLFAVVAVFFVAIVISIGVLSCKGRTTDNMEPIGDTVEVIIDSVYGGAEESGAAAIPDSVDGGLSSYEVAV